MKEFIELYAVLAAITLFDCVHWVRREALGFRAWFARIRLVRAADMPGNERFGILFAQPFPPFGVVHVVQAEPVAWTPEFASSFVTTAANPGLRPPQIGRALEWDAIRSVEVETKAVRVNGAAFVVHASARGALDVARFLEATRRLAPRARERAIERRLESALDVDEVARRAALFARASRKLRWACVVLFAHLFVVVPAVAWLAGLATWWLVLLGGLVAAQALVVALFVRAHRALYPEESRARRIEALLLSLSPPAAIRALDVLSRDLLTGFHPLAVATAWLPRAEFEAFAASVMRDVLHPLPCVREDPSPAARAAAEAWRERLRVALSGACARAGLDSKSWTGPPARADPDYAAYCPRCAEPAPRPDEACPRCPGLETRAF